MALKVVTMAELRREVLLEAQRTGEPVSSICQRFGISRQTYYRYRRRYLLEGPDGLETRSRRPNHSPGRMDPQIEIEICRMRKTLCVPETRFTGHAARLYSWIRPPRTSRLITDAGASPAGKERLVGAGAFMSSARWGRWPL